jgi:hypothetical protein
MRSRFPWLAVASVVVAGVVAASARGLQTPAATAQQPPAPRRPAAEQPPGPRPPAASLARPDSPAKAPDAAGFIRRWLVLEPVGVPPQLGEGAVQALVKQARFADQLTVLPAAGQRATVGDHQVAWHAVDTLGYNLNLFHFAYALGKPTSNVLFWTMTVVDAPRDMPAVRLAIGSNAASIWWLNGEEVIGLYNDRQSVIDDGVSRRVTLKKGPNVIRAAIVNGGGATDFCARFIDEDGNPVKGFTTRLTADGTTR